MNSIIITCTACLFFQEKNILSLYFNTHYIYTTTSFGSSRCEPTRTYKCGFRMAISYKTSPVSHCLDLYPVVDPFTWLLNRISHRNSPSFTLPFSYTPLVCCVMCDVWCALYVWCVMKKKIIIKLTMWEWIL